VWFGTFTTQFAGVTPLSIRNTIVGGGSITSTYSGSFTVNVTSTVPEPATMLLFGSGLCGVGAAIRKRRKGK
jgi:hypothetical protein